MLKSDFYSTLAKAIRDGLIETFGPSTVRAVEFFVDPSIAIRDITLYTHLLAKIFLAGSRTIEDKIAEKLYFSLGIPLEKKENYRLWDYVNEAKKMKNL